MSKAKCPQPPRASIQKTADQRPGPLLRARPVAPPVYRPQPVPKVLQRKPAMPVKPPPPLGRKVAIQPMLKSANMGGGGGEPPERPPNKPNFRPNIPPKKKRKVAPQQQQQQQQQGLSLSDLPNEILAHIGQFAGPSTENLRAASIEMRNRLPPYARTHPCCACGFQVNQPFTNFCQCGEPYHIVCAGQENFLNERYCSNCGYQLP
jgi:hypothetical protein